MIPKLADLLSTMSSLFSVRLIAIQSICVHRFHSDSLSSSTTWKGVSNRVHGRPEKNTKHVHEKANDKRIGAHESRPRIRWYDSMVVPGATGYYIIDRPSSSVPISCRDPWRSPGTTGLHVNLCTHGGKKTFTGWISTTTESAGSCSFLWFDGQPLRRAFATNNKCTILSYTFHS